MTEPVYRLWTINDHYPAMIRVTDGKGAKIAVEIWSVQAIELAQILRHEPGLSVGRIRLDDGTAVAGVLGGPVLVEGHQEITAYGGWRASIAAKGIAS